MTQDAISPITEDDIANYLVNTPSFFERHASLLAQIQLSSPHGHRAISLQERQAGMLREKIRSLEIKAADMIRHAQENTLIAHKLQHWTRELLRVRQACELPGVAAQVIAREFGVPQVAVKVWDLLPEHAHEPFAQGVSADVVAFASSLAQPYCGINPGLQVLEWLDNPAAVASLALVALRADQTPHAFGLIVLACDDPQRFTPDMGTEFLHTMGQLASAALSRLRPQV